MKYPIMMPPSRQHSVASTARPANISNMNEPLCASNLSFFIGVATEAVTPFHGYQESVIIEPGNGNLNACGAIPGLGKRSCQNLVRAESFFFHSLCHQDYTFPVRD